MHVLVAPDKFAGTLTAAEAAQAMRTGWLRQRPDDAVSIAPMSDGGPGFVDALHATLGGTLHATTVDGPLGQPTPAALLIVPGEDGTTAYIESAQACGLALLPRSPGARTPDVDVAERASTAGVGQLVAEGVDAGASTVIIGLGGSGTNDGGAGLLAALGATAEPPGALTQGAVVLGSVTAVDIAPAQTRLAGCHLIAASDVTNPLLGLRGATNVYGPQKGLSPERLFAVDGALSAFAHLVDRDAADTPGAGAAGGLGYALTVLGAEHRPGLDLVAAAAGLDDRLGQVEVVLTGEGALDPQTFTGKVVQGVAQRAAGRGVACVALAGRVEVGSRELRAAGIDGAYGVVDVAGEDEAFERPADALASLAQRVARTWGR